MNLHDWISQSSTEIRAVGGAPAPGLELNLRREGDLYRSVLHNGGGEPVAVAEVVLAADEIGLPRETAIYGEGYSMLSQYGGDFESIESFTSFTDWGHYKLPKSEGWNTVYNLLLIGTTGGRPRTAGDAMSLLGFASSRRFGGEFRFRPGQLEVVLNIEGTQIQPGEEWQLVDLLVATGEDRHAVLSELADRLAVAHPRFPWPKRPTDWCSWYCYGPSVTAEDISANLDAIRSRDLPLAYVQIDDGYQAAMGDWLTPAPAEEAVRTVRNLLSQEVVNVEARPGAGAIASVTLPARDAAILVVSR